MADGMSGYYPTTTCSTSNPLTIVNSPPSSRPALPDRLTLTVSPFLGLRSLRIACSPAEPCPSLHHVFEVTFHLNAAPFLYLHHHHWQSQTIIFIRLLYLSPRAFHSKLKCHLFKNSCPDRLIRSSMLPCTLVLTDTRLSSCSVSSDPLEIGPEPTMDNTLDNPFDSWQRS